MRNKETRAVFFAAAPESEAWRNDVSVTLSNIGPAAEDSVSRSPGPPGKFHDVMNYRSGTEWKETRLIIIIMCIAS